VPPVPVPNEVIVVPAVIPVPLMILPIAIVPEVTAVTVNTFDVTEPVTTAVVGLLIEAVTAVAPYVPPHAVKSVFPTEVIVYGVPVTKLPAVTVPPEADVNKLPAAPGDTVLTGFVEVEPAVTIALGVNDVTPVPPESTVRGAASLDIVTPLIAPPRILTAVSLWVPNVPNKYEIFDTNNVFASCSGDKKEIIGVR